ncbi:hypothetical protein PS682_04282 [Pseudomonas fluorescens]|nr:hypothetical protein PS682_04282 [Pseudomonas fluorescens]
MEQLALARQAEAAPAAMAQHQAQRRLQLAHISADGRGGQVEFVLGIGKPLVAHNADEDAQEFQVGQGVGHGFSRNTQKPVGAGLLANAVDQWSYLWLTRRIREQARSHL